MARAAHPRHHVLFSFYSFFTSPANFLANRQHQNIPTMMAATTTAIESHTHNLQQIQI